MRGQSLSAHPWSTVLELRMSEDRWATEGCTEGITAVCLNTRLIVSHMCRLGPRDESLSMPGGNPL